MFYCEPCGKKKGWPASVSLSMGRCELCGTITGCNDVPHSQLPPPEPPKPTIQQEADFDQALHGMSLALVGQALFMVLTRRNSKADQWKINAIYNELRERDRIAINFAAAQETLANRISTITIPRVIGQTGGYATGYVDGRREAIMKAAEMVREALAYPARVSNEKESGPGEEDGTWAKEHESRFKS